MVFGLGLGAGLKALTAAQLGIQTAGQNVANVNTPGYTRQRVLQAATLPMGVGAGMQIGTGVSITDISRVVDVGLEARMRMQMGLFGSTAVDHQRFLELEGAFGEPDGGLGTLFSDFFGAISSLQTDPADRSLRGGLVQGGKSLADGFNLLSNRITGLQGSTFTEVGGLVRQVNEHADAIAQLNVQIISLEVNDAKANDLRDTRERHIKEITALVDTQVLDRRTGSVDLLVGGHLLVSGDRATNLSATVDPAGMTRVVAGSDTSVLNLRSGRIHGLLRHEATQMPGVLSRVDTAARNLILEFNRLHSTGVPQRGSFNSLTSFYGAVDGDSDGVRGDELLGQAGLPFDIQGGALYVTVTTDGSSDIERTRIDIDPSAMTLNDLANTISGLDHVSATVDASGRMRISAESGYGFHFGTGLDPNPNAAETFGVDVDISGAYTGTSNDQLTFRPDGDGEIGVTAGLTVGVFDSNGTRIATLDVGRDYSPTTTLEVADGIKVSFGAGTISQTGGESFALDTLADSDTSDVLVALGLNSFFHGSTAADIEINAALAANPDLVAAGLSDASGDADNLGRMMALRERGLGGLGSNTIEEFYAGLVSDIGLETSSAALTLANEEALMVHLEQQREAVSGVNVDEEMVDLVRFQHAFEAAARFIDTVNELASTLINLGR